MSLDIYLVTRGGTVIFDANMTHNVTPMWRKAGCYAALYESHGKQAGDVLQQLQDGRAAMLAAPDDYKALNPPNGWGCYEGAVEFLERVITAFEHDPLETVEVSR